MKTISILLFIVSCVIAETKFDPTKYYSIVGTSQKVLEACITIVYKVEFDNNESIELLNSLASVVRVLPELDKNYKYTNDLVLKSCKKSLINYDNNNTDFSKIYIENLIKSAKI